MRAFLRENKKVRFVFRLFGLILALTLVWFVCVQVIGFSVDIVPKGSLAAGQAKWEQKGRSSYRMTIQVYKPLRVFGQYTVTVKQGKVVEGGFRLSSSSARDGASFMPLSQDQIDQICEYTIDQMFAFSQAQVANVPEVRVGVCPATRYTVETDPELGYIKTFYADSCQTGLLCPAISECFSGFKVLNLELLPE
jgi:hypothetical protein